MALGARVKGAQAQAVLVSLMCALLAVCMQGSASCCLPCSRVSLGWCGHAVDPCPCLPCACCRHCCRSWVLRRLPACTTSRTATLMLPQWPAWAQWTWWCHQCRACCWEGEQATFRLLVWPFPVVAAGCGFLRTYFSGASDLHALQPSMCCCLLQVPAAAWR